MQPPFFSIAKETGSPSVQKLTAGHNPPSYCEGTFGKNTERSDLKTTMKLVYTTENDERHTYR